MESPPAIARFRPKKTGPARRLDPLQSGGVAATAPDMQGGQGQPTPSGGPLAARTGIAIDDRIIGSG